MDCPEHSFYNTEMSLDVETCSNPDGYYEVSNGNGEGCECVPGYVMDGHDCVPIETCGCVIPLEDEIYIHVRHFWNCMIYYIIV